MSELSTIARSVVFGAFSLSLLVTLAAWVVRTRRVSPFGPWGRALRSVSDPVLAPIERTLVRTGGSPRHAGWWLVIGVAVVGVVLLTLLDWLELLWMQAAGAVGGGVVPLGRLAVTVAYDVLVLALFVRVVGSWLGAFRYARGLRVVYTLTDWLIEPLRRVLPPVGAFDWSPVAAWLVLWVLRQLLLTVI